MEKAATSWQADAEQKEIQRRREELQQLEVAGGSLGNIYRLHDSQVPVDAFLMRVLSTDGKSLLESPSS